MLSVFFITVSSAEYLENRMYSANVKGIHIQSADTPILEKIESLNSGYVITKTIDDELRIKRGYYSTSDLFGLSAFIETGRFFTNSDYKENSPVAVIGADIIADTVTENGKTYYGYSNTQYEVIGIFKQTNSDLDKAAYLNLTYLLDSEGSSGLYCIDGNSEDVSKAVNAFINDSRTKSSEIKIEQKNYDMNVGHKIKFYCAIIAALCNLIIISYYFVSRQSYKTAVKKLCGFTNKRLSVSYAVTLTCITIGGYLIGAGILYLVQKNVPGLQMAMLDPIHYIIVLICIVLSGGLITASIIKKVMKVDISSILKG